MKKLFFCSLLFSHLLNAQTTNNNKAILKDPVLNLADSLKNGKYAVLKPIASNSVSKTSTARLAFVSLPANSGTWSKIVLNADVLCQKSNTNYKACLDLPRGALLIEHLPVPVIQLQGQHDVRVSCDFRESKRYLITLDVEDVTMNQPIRNYTIQGTNMNQVTFSFRRRGNLSFVVDLSGANNTETSFGFEITTNTSIGGTYKIYSCKIEEF